MPIQDIQPGDYWVTTTQGMSGHFAVLMWLNPGEDFGPFAEPYDTGIGRFATKDEAIEEAELMADQMGFKYIPA